MLRFIHLQQLSSETGAGKLVTCHKLIHNTAEGKSGKDKSLNCTWDSVKSQHLRGSGYVVLLLFTGLPPFIIADALVLLLGVTPAFGTVSPISCKDGSRYMATEGKEKKGRSIFSNVSHMRVHLK